MLQGHTSAITCVRASEDTSLVVTADTGPDSMIIVWNTETAQPRVTIPQPHANGTIAMDLSLDGTLLVTLSKPEESDGLQEIALWDLSSPGTCTSTIRIPIPAGDVQVRPSSLDDAIAPASPVAVETYVQQARTDCHLVSPEGTIHT